MIRRRDRQTGFSLLELMVTMVIIFVLATMALPLSKNIAKRAKETELKQRLQILRRAIDDFNRDWNRDGDNLLGELCKQNKLTCKEVSSPFGYPKKLKLLLGVELTGEIEKSTRSYLRKALSRSDDRIGRVGIALLYRSPRFRHLVRRRCLRHLYDK
ncbi:MAG: type II secretion system protein [Candidatus Manganitrophus sp.]|nr:type II secretion system protein [Candidatus Manganitrophus sp.]